MSGDQRDVTFDSGATTIRLVSGFAGIGRLGLYKTDPKEKREIKGRYRKGGVKRIDRILSWA